MIEYKLKQDIRNLIVCLYDPKSETQFTQDTLSNYIDACAWQLEHGQIPRRIPFHVTMVPSDATRAINDYTYIIQSQRKPSKEKQISWDNFKF